jgi:AcrR family transcriptional regulator
VLVSGAEVRRRRGRPPEPWRADRILDAARRLFAERGFHGVSVDEIGRAAGTTGAAIYRHFVGKEDLLLTLLNDVQNHYLAALPPRSDDAFEELGNLLACQIELTADNRHLAGVWTQQHHVLDDQRFRGYLRGEHVYFDRWTDCLLRCFPHLTPEDGERVGRAVIEMTTFLIASPTRTVDQRELGLVTTILWNGLLSLAGEVPAEGGD